METNMEKKIRIQRDIDFYEDRIKTYQNRLKKAKERYNSIK